VNDRLSCVRAGALRRRWIIDIVPDRVFLGATAFAPGHVQIMVIASFTKPTTKPAAKRGTAD